jgi:two-component system, OmpR family, aerobic respiration control sensor histidine kinase ArcB
MGSDPYWGARSRIQTMQYSIDSAQIIDSLRVNIIWKDLDSRYIGANQHFLQVVGLSDEALVGKTDYDLTTDELARKVIENDQEVFTKREACSFHEYILDGQGNIKVYLSYKTPLFDHQGELFGLTTLAIDITEISEKESLLMAESQAQSYYIESMAYFDQLATMLSQMAANIPANIYWKDLRGVYLGCNAMQNQIAKVNWHTNIIGKTLHEFLPKEQADKFAKVDDQVMTQGKVISLEEESYDSKGRPATYLSSKSPVRNDRGEVIGMLGISLNITKQKQTEQNLRLMKEKVEAALRAKSEFIMNISHDIRTPFMGILGFSEILEAQEQDEFKKETLGYIRQSAERLLSWMNEIIDVVSSSGENTEVDQPIDIHHLLEDLTELMRARVEFKKLHWLIIIDPAIPQHLVGDLAGIRRILLNLVGNAVKFTDEGGVTVEVKVLSQSANNVNLEFRVKDTGIGISAENYAKIFKKFSRLKSSSTESYPSSGLGLYNVSQIVERLGGSVDVASTLGKGSIFSFQIPFKLELHAESLE